MSEELSGIELRKALALALGWTVADESDDTGVRFVVRHNGAIVGQNNWSDMVWEVCIPHFESDPAVSEQTLDAECKKRGWGWRIDFNPLFTKGPYHADIFTPGANGEGIDHAWGCTPSEARARALLKALQSIVSEQPLQPTKETR